MQNLFKSMHAVKSKRGYTLFTAVLVAIFSTVVFTDAAKAEVVIAADGDVQTVKTNTDTVGDLLEDLGIDVGQYDELSHTEGTEIINGMEIRFKSAHKVLLTVDDDKEEYHTTAITLGQFFDEEGFEFSRYDDISHSDIAILNNDMEINVDTAVPVTINDGGEKEKVWTTEDTVEDLLKKEEVDFDKQDRIKPALDEKVKKDMKVNVTHVDTKKEDKEESIPFDTEKKNDDSLAKGEEKTVTEGKKGKKVKTYEITLENGKEVDREVIDEEVVKESQNEVIAVGTKEETKAAEEDTSSSSTKAEASASDNSGSDESSNSEESGKSMTMEATAYGPDCSGCSGVSATGMDLTGGGKVIAVDPSVIPLGSRVWVEGYGEAIAGDTGGAINGNRIDVLYPTEASASDWGRRSVQVKVLD